MHIRSNLQSLALPRLALIATAIGAVAVGAFAIGALAIGRLAIRRLAVANAKLKSLEIEDLTVKRRHAAEVTVSDSLKLPGYNADRATSARPAQHRPESSFGILMEEIMSRESRMLAGILLVVIPTVMYGGLTLLYDADAERARVRR